MSRSSHTARHQEQQGDRSQSSGVKQAPSDAKLRSANHLSEYIVARPTGWPSQGLLLPHSCGSPQTFCCIQPGPDKPCHLSAN